MMKGKMVVDNHYVTTYIDTEFNYYRLSDNTVANICEWCNSDRTKDMLLTCDTDRLMVLCDSNSKNVFFRNSEGYSKEYHSDVLSELKKLGFC